MHFDYVMLAAIDRQTRSLVGELEFFGASASLREVFDRPPDVDDGRMMSWGGVTLEESLRLAACQPFPEDRSDLSESVAALFAAAPASMFTVYYCDRYHGE
ncbi:MAG: hypothetical protein HOW73_22615 [Polyangiaceae bacterium]|nr:hypothetical protein [Polyangiaceae bacterium]